MNSIVGWSWVALVWTSSNWTKTPQINKENPTSENPPAINAIRTTSPTCRKVSVSRCLEPSIGSRNYHRNHGIPRWFPIFTRLTPPDKWTWETKKWMVCCLDVNVFFPKGPFSGFMLVFRGRNPSSHHGSVEHVSTKPVSSHLHVSLFNSSGFRGHNAWKTVLFLKAIQDWTQTTHMLLQFPRFPPLPPKASSNQRAEINDFCESHFCSTEKTGSTFFGALTFLELPCDLASLMFCAHVVWYSQIVWRRVNHVRSLTQRFGSGFLFGLPAKANNH